MPTRRRQADPHPPDSDTPRTVPVAMRARYEEVVRLTDAACLQALDAEYAALARRAAEVLSRKRPSPLAGGRAPGWACGIVYALGRINFLFDRSFPPYLSAGELCALFGVSAATGAAKAGEVLRALKAGQMDPDWTVPSRMDRHPYAWMVKVNGFIVDARTLPRDFQEMLAEEGLIPYVPGASGGEAE